MSSRKNATDRRLFSGAFLGSIAVGWAGIHFLPPVLLHKMSFWSGAGIVALLQRFFNTFGAFLQGLLVFVLLYCAFLTILTFFC